MGWKGICFTLHRQEAMSPSCLCMHASDLRNLFSAFCWALVNLLLIILVSSCILGLLEVTLKFSFALYTLHVVVLSLLSRSGCFLSFFSRSVYLCVCVREKVVSTWMLMKDITVNVSGGGSAISPGRPWQLSGLHSFRASLTTPSSWTDNQWMCTELQHCFTDMLPVLRDCGCDDLTHTRMYIYIFFFNYSEKLFWVLAV